VLLQASGFLVAIPIFKAETSLVNLSKKLLDCSLKVSRE